MSEAFRAPEPDTARVARRDGQSQAPQVAPHVARVINENPALQRAIEAQAAKPPPEPEAPPDPEKTLAAPLDALPQWEAEHSFVLSTSVQRGSQMLTAIRLRAPNGLDMFEVGGLPTRTQWSPGGMTVEMDTERFKKWLGRLVLDCDMPTLYRIPARDMRAMYEWLNGELNQAGN